MTCSCNFKSRYPPDYDKLLCKIHDKLPNTKEDEGKTS